LKESECVGLDLTRVTRLARPPFKHFDGGVAGKPMSILKTSGAVLEAAGRALGVGTKPGVEVEWGWGWGWGCARTRLVASARVRAVAGSASQNFVPRTWGQNSEGTLEVHLRPSPGGRSTAKMRESVGMLL
jgi:hypothetical protein